MLPPVSPATEMLRRAMAAHQSGKPDVARDLFGRVLLIDAGRPDVHYQLGRLELAEGNPKAALRHLKTARKIKPDEPAIWLTTLDALLTLKDRAAIRDLLARAKKAGLPKARLVELQTRARIGNSGGMAKLGGLSPAAFQNALDRYNRGDLAGAEQAAQALHAAHPGVAPVLALLGATQVRLGKKQDAVASYRHALDIDPDYVEAHQQFGQLLIQLNDYTAARGHLETALAKAPNSPIAKLGMGMVELQIGTPRAALKHLLEARAALPDSVELLSPLARAHLQTGDMDSARDIIGLALSKAPDNPETHRVRGDILAEMGAYDDAITAYDTALSLTDSPARILTAKAYLFNELGRFDDMHAIAEDLIARGDIDAGLFRSYARSLRAAPDPAILAAAEALFDRIAPDAPDRAPMAFALSTLTEKTGDRATAFRFMKMANAAQKASHPIPEPELWGLADMSARVVARGLPVITAPGPSMPRPIFVCGMPRSGTTLVEQILGSHGDVTALGEIGIAVHQATDLMELRDAAQQPLTAADAAKLRDGVLAAYAAQSDGRPVVTDKAITSYQLLPLLRAVLPDSLAVVVRRDPRDNCLSMFKNMFVAGTHRYTTDLEVLGRHYLGFLDRLARLRAAYPDSLYEIRYEDLIAAPDAQARALVARCGLDWQESCLNFHQSDRRVKTLSAFQVRQPIYASSVGAWKAYADQLAPLIRILDAGGALDDYRDGPSA